MTILKTMLQGIRASVTLDNINLSDDAGLGGPNRQPIIGGGRIDLVGGLHQSYEAIYRDQIWVSAVANKLSRGMGRLPLKVYQRGEDSERTRLTDGYLYNLLNRPYEGCSPFGFKSTVISNVAIHGNCVAVKTGRRGPGQPPTELIPSSFGYWTVMPGVDRPIDWYLFRNSIGAQIPFRPEEVVHWKWWGTGLNVAGQAPLQPLRRTLLIEDAAQRLMMASYENGARPAGAFSVQGNPKKEQIEEMRGELERVYGGVDNAFKMAIMGGGAEWKPMSHSLIDAGLYQTRQLTREEVAAAYDMPPPVIQILDKATFSNISEQHLMLYMDTMGPWLTMFEETLQVQLIDPEPTMRGQFLEFDLNEVLKGDIATRLTALASATNFMTPNEKRAKENLPKMNVPEADAIWFASGSLPIGEGVDTASFLKNPVAAAQEGAPKSESILLSPSAAAARVVEEAHCHDPACNRLLGKNIASGGVIRCHKCGKDTRF